MKNWANSFGLLSVDSLCFLVILGLMYPFFLIIYSWMNVLSLLLFARPFANLRGILCKPLKTGTSNVWLEKVCFTGTNVLSHSPIVGARGTLKIRLSGSSTASPSSFRIFQYSFLMKHWPIILLNLGLFFFVFAGDASLPTTNTLFASASFSQYFIGLLFVLLLQRISWVFSSCTSTCL